VEHEPKKRFSGAGPLAAGDYSAGGYGKRPSHSFHLQIDHRQVGIIFFDVHKDLFAQSLDILLIKDTLALFYEVAFTIHFNDRQPFPAFPDFKK